MAVCFRILLLLCLALPALAQPSKVYTVPTVPNPKQAGAGYISDPDRFLTPAEKAELNQRIAAIEDSTTAQIAVVLIGSIGEENPKEFATRLFQHWGIGQADRDNGLLILSVMDQRRTEFETGYGMEAVLPDAYCYRIGMQELVPHYREGQYGMGLMKTVARIGEILENPESFGDILSSSDKQGKRRSKAPPDLQGFLWIIALINISFIAIVFLRVAWVMRSKDDLYDKYRAIRPWKSWFYIFIAPLLYVPVYFFLVSMLRKLRDQPRFSRVNGKSMRKLSEAEEDHFLEQGQITEEDIGSVDYDVWVTEEEDDTLILRYAKRFSKYTSCPECHFSTYHLVQTAVIQRATYTSSGVREVQYLCKNCGYQKTARHIIPKLTQSSGGSSRGGGSSSWGGGRSGGGGSGVSW